jgi:HlyD family secretion protein
MIMKRLVFAGICTVFAAIGCGKKESSTAEERVTIKRVDLRDVLTQTGEVRPVVKVDIKSEASGRIDTVYVKEGQRVRKGDTIIIIDPSRLLFKRDRLQLAVQKAQINIDKAKRDLETARNLVSTGTVSSQSVEDLESALKLAEIELSQQALDLKDVNDELGKTIVTSPMDGVVTILDADAGEIAVSATTGFSGGTSIATIADISRLEVVSQVGAADYTNLKTGQKVIIRPEAFENINTTGKITFIALSAKKAAEGELGTFEVRITIDSVTAGVTAGINVNVEFVMLEKSGVLGVPNFAVRKKDGKYSVMKIAGGNGKDAPRPVEVSVGATDFRHYEVLSGLSEGDIVVVTSEKDSRGKPGSKGQAPSGGGGPRGR